MPTIFERDTAKAFCTDAPIEILSKKSGPLKDLSFGVKDIFDIANVPTGFGSPAWLNTMIPRPSVANPRAGDKSHDLKTPNLPANTANKARPTPVQNKKRANVSKRDNITVGSFLAEQSKICLSL